MIAAATELWPSQRDGIDGINHAIAAGHRRICLTGPTGSGKTRIMQELIDDWLHEGRRVSLYTNRRMLVDQLASVMAQAGIRHGVRAADYEREAHHALQISSVQTEASRVLKRGVWALHESERILVDEAHLQTGNDIRRLLGRHLEHDSAVVIGFTATPLDLGNLYDRLVVAGTPSQLRACGALVPAVHYGCDEPDLRQIKKVNVGEDLSESQIRQVIMRPGIFGRVSSEWKRLNPEGLPTIGFAPGVPEAVWFCEQFQKIGVRCAAIDGTNCWLDGEQQPTSPELRQEILDGSKAGTIAIVWNRFVLREGIDCPWLCHGILATVFGSLQSYLQSGGRLLRAAPEKKIAIIQDHGGNYWRHGSLNADRHWELCYTPGIVTGLREQRLREKLDREPIRCPQCSGIRQSGPKCPHCGHQHLESSRMVVETDGTLREHKGVIFRPRPVSMRPSTAKLWERMYYRAKKSKNRMNFNQAYGFFFYENHHWCPRDLPLMPVQDIDWFLPVADVPRERLRNG